MYQPFEDDHVASPLMPLSIPASPPSPAPPTLPAPPAPLLPGLGGGTGAPPSIGVAPKYRCLVSLLTWCPPTLIN